MTKTTAETYLAQSSLLRLLAVLGLVLAPHLVRTPWIGAAVLAIGIWRAAAAVKLWPLPPVWLKVMMVLAAFAGVSLSFPGRIGQQFGTALLVLMLALKLTEMRSRRDVLVVVALCYFTMLTHFLFSQEIWTILYLGACSVGVTAVLIEANHPGAPLSPRVTLRLGGSMVLLALPLMLALFVLFPRVPGPLWGLPADAGAARSGISDTMSPGDIASLIQSDEVAFRVEFSGTPPPMNQRYWRGPVLSYFERGRVWRAEFRGDDFFRLYDPATQVKAFEPASASVAGEPVRYRVTMEPHRQNWLFALDLPESRALPPIGRLTGYYQLLSRELVKERLRYEAVSYPSYVLDPELAPKWQRSAQALPDGSNPRALALSRQWRAEGLDDSQVIARALRLFSTEPFHYTLEPPTLGQHMVDDFLFDTRRGFCEHYASAFTVLMRGAGIPARVVVGYQGGELNEVGGYYVVRQSDAHAWSEVWLAGRGWVRVDPTAAVAPSRVERGLSEALAPAELPDFLRRGGLTAFEYFRLQADTAWDYINVAWDQWVLGFDQERQFELLNRFGLGEWRDMVIALTVLVALFMGLVGALSLRSARIAAPKDEALRLWRRATRVLARRGLAQEPAEGPHDYAARVARERPELAPAMEQLVRAYVAARYYDDRPRENVLELAAALKALGNVRAARGSPTSPETAA